MRATFSNLLQNVAQNVSDRLLHIVPPNLDLHYINDRILAMSHCARATKPTFSDDGRKNESIWNTNNNNNNNNTTYRGGGTKRKRSLGNNPADVSTFLQNRHDSHYLVFSLSEAVPDDRSLYLLRRQLLHWNWESPGKQNSTTPCLSQLMDLCYAIHAYLNVDSRNVIVISCANGKTRSAIVIACYLKYACLVDTSLQGFAAFLQRRCPKLDSTKASMHIPPSLLQFFRNFDDALELGDFANTKPLLLRAVALEGVPVADKPCLDIWDSQQNHVYSSLSSNDSAQWADEEGFYKVNRILEGDFCLLCRFGGIYAADMDDPSKVLFRYANSIGFLNSGTYELPKKKVDMMRRYEMSFEEDDFLLTLIFESYWVIPSPTPGLELDSKQLPPILKGYAALERGWHLLTQHHAAKPIDADYHSLRSFFPELQHCPDHICKVGLQLSNFDFRQAQHLLVKGPMREWWRLGNHDDGNDSNMQLDDCDDLESTFDQPNPIRPVTPEFTPFDVLNILDDDDETDSIESGQSAPREPQHSQIRYEPILYPNRGDIVNSFRSHSKDSAKQSVDFNPITTSTRPRIPLQKRKRAKPVNQNQNSKKVRGDDSIEEEIETALNALEQINHTGVTLEDLLNLQRTSSKIQAFHGGKEAEDDAESMFSSQDYEMTLKDTGDIRRQDTISIDGDDEDVDGFEIADENDKPGEHDQFLGFAVKGTKQDIELKVDNDGDDVPLKDDPEYSKYFKMLKMGLTMDMVKHSMTRDGKDPAIMDLDHNKSLKSQQEKPKASTEGNDPPLKEDPEYVKYFKMLKMGLPMDVVKHAMKRDGCDPSIMDLNHDMSLKSQRGGAEDDGPPLKEDPEYEKYFKMLKMGLPMGAVQNALQRDGKDPSIMDLDPNKSLKSQMAGTPEDDGPPLKDDPDYEKYFKMLKMGLPIDAVKHAIQRDGKDPSVMDLDPNKSVKSQMGGGDKEEDTGPAIKDDPEYEKYFKMLKMGLPMDAVKHAIQRDGKDPNVMDLDPNKSIKSQMGGGDGNEDIDNGVPLKDDPEYAKYFKMLKMGLPIGAVKNALLRDGKDMSIMDLDPEKSLSFQLARKGTGGGNRPVARKKVKKRVRRKKIYWTPIDPKKVVEGSLWDIVKGEFDMEKLSYDQVEFETLFTESTNPADKTKKEAKASTSKKKEAVQLIDGKRSMNGGIILARLKMTYSQIADMVNIMDAGDFDSTQLMALKEFLPSDEERGALGNYVKDLPASEEEKEKGISVLPACEKYMIAMMDVKNAQAKFDCMLFGVQFQNLLDELVQGIKTVRKACDDVRHSEKLRKMMAMILTLVNQINTGGDGTMALGFSLEALSKLGEAKAFDKKTSVLHYLAKLIRQNDESLLTFADDVISIAPAVTVVLDGLVGDMKMINEQLTKVMETTISEADILEAEGKLPTLSISTISDTKQVVEGDEDGDKAASKSENDMSENPETQPAGTGEESQNDALDTISPPPTTISKNENVCEGSDAPKMRTPMERFVHQAKREVDDALKSLEELKTRYSDLLKYFGEDENLQSNEFFGTLQKFIIEFNAAAEQVEKAEKGKLKEKLKKAAKKAANLKLIQDIASNLKNNDDELSDSRTKDNLPSNEEDSDPKTVKEDALDDQKGAEQGSTNNSGIASVAPTATPERGLDKKGRPDIGSLAAMAAMAALKRSKKEPKDENSSTNTPKPSIFGGIAAMAAAAAAAKLRLGEEELPHIDEQPSLVDEASNPNGDNPLAEAKATADKASLGRDTITSDDGKSSTKSALELNDKPRELGLVSMGEEEVDHSENLAYEGMQVVENIPIANGIHISDIAAMAAKAALNRQIASIEPTSDDGPKKRSSYDDDLGDDNSSGGESSSSKKFKSTAQLPENSESREITHFESGQNNETAIPNFSQKEKASSEVSETDAKNDCERSQSSSVVTEFTHNLTGSGNDAQEQPTISLHLNPNSDFVDDNGSVIEKAKKNKGHKEKDKKKKKKKKNILHQEDLLPSDGKLLSHPLLKSNIDPVAEEQTDSNSSKPALDSKAKKNAVGLSTIGHLSPLRSETFIRSHPLDVDDNFDSFILTLGEEEVVLPITKKSEAQSLPTQRSDIIHPKEEGDLKDTSMTILSEVKSDSMMQENSSNPLQRWFQQSFGSSRDLSENQNSKSKLDEESHK